MSRHLVRPWRFHSLIGFNYPRITGCMPSFLPRQYRNSAAPLGSLFINSTWASDIQDNTGHPPPLRKKEQKCTLVLSKFLFITLPSLKIFCKSNDNKKVKFTFRKFQKHPPTLRGQYPRRPTQSGTVPLLWNSSTICGTTSQKCGTAPQTVEQVLKAGHCITNCGTVPKFVELLLLKVACYFKCGTVSHFWLRITS